MRKKTQPFYKDPKYKKNIFVNTYFVEKLNKLFTTGHIIMKEEYMTEY